MGITAAVAEWQHALGPDGVLAGRDCERYAIDTSGVRRRVPVALRPRTEDDVVALVKIAARHGCPLYPVSTGRNWGYGGGNPVIDDCVVVDLSRMAAIRHIDRELGLVTLQPGVTQQQLFDALALENLPFMVPVTGAGPTCSLVGNALERGYGITPHGDHFGAVTAIRAVLPSGQCYSSALGAKGSERIDRAHKWGVGPYLDGLFAQGSFGIVTEMTIALARRPERVEMFMFELPHRDALGPAVEAVRELMQSAGSGIGGVNLLNRLRVLSMVAPYPADRVGPGEVIRPELLEELGRKQRLPEWLGIGALYGTREVVGALRRVVKRILGSVASRVLFVSPDRIALLRAASTLVPGELGAVLRGKVGKLAEALAIMSGEPKETALSLAYWRSGRRPADGTALDPARDGCGLIWYAPLVPMTADAVGDYVAMVEQTCPGFGIEPLITLTTISDRCFDSTVPILFDPALQARKAQDCYGALYAEGARRGFLPYRLSVASMALYTEDGSAFWELARQLKRSVDPEGLIAPGRYAPLA